MPPTPTPAPSPVPKLLTPLLHQQLLQLRKKPHQQEVQKQQATVVKSHDVEVENLRPHEFPVIGLYVHPNIVPGFKYRVRPLSSPNSKHLFNGMALELLSIGQGYGKRITFKPEDGMKNGNENYFWSDSRPEGYGFELEVVSPGDKFTIYDATHTKVGDCEVIQNEEPQVEQSHHTWSENGTIEKWVVTKLRCKIVTHEGSMFEDVISGIAISSKAGNNGVITTSAFLVRIMNANMSHSLEHHSNNNLNNNKNRVGWIPSSHARLTLMPGVDSHFNRTTVYGANLSDVPTTYTIIGLQSHEFPVIGTYVDKRILPGFHYIVRPAASKFSFFGGKPLPLLSIGRGYGKRFTFDSSHKNANDNFFWSDSYPEGFGFAPQAVFEGHRFRIFVGDDQIGTAVVTKASKPQEELQMVQLPEGGVLKRFRVDVNCSMDVRNVTTRSCRVCGTAVVVRRNGPESPSRLEMIEDVGLDTELCKNFRYIPGEVKFIAFEYQKYLRECK